MRKKKKKRRNRFMMRRSKRWRRWRRERNEIKEEVEEEEEEVEVVLVALMPIVLPQTLSAVSGVSANAPSTNLGTQSATLERRRCFSNNFLEFSILRSLIVPFHPSLPSKTCAGQTDECLSFLMNCLCMQSLRSCHSIAGCLSTQELITRTI